VPPSDEPILSRVRTSGVRAASIVDLIAIGFSRREEDVQSSESMCRRMLHRFMNLRGFTNAAPSDLSEFTGLEGFEVLRAQSLMEIGRRSHLSGKGERVSIESADEALVLLDWLRDEMREHFVAILLDAKNQVMRTAEIHIGTLTMSVVGAREVFREAIRDGASAIIVAHNHPSGDPEPSPEDIQVTRQLVEIGKMLDIPVLDHVIIGERRAVSLRQRGHVE
jgi:DNA repair protein RadC